MPVTKRTGRTRRCLISSPSSHFVISPQPERVEMKRRLLALVTTMLASISLVLFATPASANDIRIFTTYTECGTPDPADTSGTIRIYVRWLRDLTPNPDRVRPLAFTVQNRFNHTTGVTGVSHYSRAGVVNSWMDSIVNNGQVVLTVPSTSGSHQFGTRWAQNEPGVDTMQDEINFHSSMPYNTDISNGLFISNQVGPYSSPDARWVNNNQPWWTELRNDGPYFLVSYLVQGDYSACGGWYPP
jgi:hypothetical protein